VKVSFEGREYGLDTGHMSFRHALEVQKQTGMSIGDWEDSLAFHKDPDDPEGKKWLNPPPEWLVSVGALYWLMLAQNGGAPDPDGLDFDWQEFLSAYFAALSAELDRLKAEAAPEPDPTSPAAAPVPASTVPSTRTATTRTPRGSEEGAATGS
jgi:hypothetical protein